MKNKRLISFMLALLCLCGSFALPAFAAEGFENLTKKTYAYTPGHFPDVGIAAWYTPYVAEVYELGLMRGNNSGMFCPGGDVTLAETLALAARLHKLYTTGSAELQQGEPWYQVYVDYAKENGILEKEYPDYNAAAKRSEFAALLARALPVSALVEMNAVEDGQLPDVPVYAEAAAEIYLLYRAGVLTGNDKYGTFAPNNRIHRSEVAAIVARMANPTLRVSFTLKTAYRYPELQKGDRMEDAFFFDAAMLGNSLVDGMMLYSGLPMDYYGGTGLTVFKNKLEQLLQQQYGKVYIQFGINEIGVAQDKFIDSYRQIVERIHAVLPDAQVYIMAITPVTKARSDDGVFTMKKIREMNEALYALAEETDCWYLDTCTALCDATGYLPDKHGGWDGSPHLATGGYVAWAEVIRSYYAE